MFFDTNIELASDLKGVSRECARAYNELENWAHTHMFAFNALSKAIETLAAVYGWSEEESVKDWAFHLTADDVLKVCKDYALHFDRAMVVQQLRKSPSSFNPTVLAFARLFDACGATASFRMVKGLLKAQGAQ